MLKDKKTSLRLANGSMKLRSSIDSLPCGLPQESLSQSCNFAQRASLVVGQRMFKKSRHPFSQSTTLLPFSENYSPNNPIKIQQHPTPCQNHQSKPAQFRVLTQGDTMYYCERCAISLASQGFNVVRIDGVAEKKPIEVEFLIDHIDLLRETMGKKMEQATKLQVQKRAMIEGAEESVEGYYAEVIRIVHECRKEALTQLESLKQKHLTQSPNLQQTYTEKLHELSAMREQISNQSDLQSTRTNQYRQRLTVYKSKLEGYRKFLAQAQSQAQLTLKIPAASHLTTNLKSILTLPLHDSKGEEFSFSKSNKSKSPGRQVSQFS